MPVRFALVAWLVVTASASASDAKIALQPFNDLIGSWKATGTPEGTREEKQRGFWVETVSWRWQFKGEDAWLTAAIENGKHYRKAELRPLKEKGQYRLTLTPVGKGAEPLVFTGSLEDRRLTVSRTDEQSKETQQLVVSLLHSNRFLYRYEVKPAGKTLFTKVYQVGATEEGEPFAAGDGKPECIVSGGLGTMRVTFKGQTYYVCCSGCRDAFNEEPEKYIREFEEAKKNKKK